MTSVITGDIIHSQKADAQVWLKKLKSEFNDIGSSPESWEIYRGDSFQLEITDPALALKAAITIKSVIKSIKQII